MRQKAEPMQNSKKITREKLDKSKRALAYAVIHYKEHRKEALRLFEREQSLISQAKAILNSDIGK